MVEVDIYLKMRAIAEDYHVYTDQLRAIAKWVKSEFKYLPKELEINNKAKSSNLQKTVRQNLINLLEAAPDMCQALKAAKAIFEAQGIDESHSICGEQYEMVEKALMKADGITEVEFEEK